MKCDTPGCIQEGHVMDKFGVFCHECNDKNIEVIESKFFQQKKDEDEYKEFIKKAFKKSKSELIADGLEDIKKGKFAKVVLSKSTCKHQNWEPSGEPGLINCPDCGSSLDHVPQYVDSEKFKEVAKKVLEKHAHTFAKLAPNDVHKIMTLPTDSAERKTFPLFAGVLRYFPAALAGVARTSKLGNDKHNPGQELHHARGKSTDHGDCILRHLMDTQDLIAARSRGDLITDQQILDEANQMAWRALAYVQELHESFGAPMAPGAKK